MAWLRRKPNWFDSDSSRFKFVVYVALRQGWVLFKRTCEFSGIQFTKHFIEFVFVETNKAVRSNSNVILTRQTCSQRSCRVAGSKRRALAFYFSMRIWYVFSTSICKGKLDLGLCVISLLAKRMWPHSTDFWFKNLFDRRIRRKSALRTRILFASTEVMHRPRSYFPLHYDVKNISQIWKNRMLALGVWFPQPCSSNGRRFAAPRSCLSSYRKFGSFPQERIQWNAL